MPTASTGRVSVCIRQYNHLFVSNRLFKQLTLFDHFNVGEDGADLPILAGSQVKAWIESGSRK